MKIGQIKQNKFGYEQAIYTDTKVFICRWCYNLGISSERKWIDRIPDEFYKTKLVGYLRFYLMHRYPILKYNTINPLCAVVKFSKGDYLVLQNFFDGTKLQKVKFLQIGGGKNEKIIFKI